MKQKKLQQVIHKRVKQMAKLAASETHDADVVYSLRKLYKKLRASLRMYHGLSNAKLLPATLNKIYKTSGAIRDLQLHIAFIEKSHVASLPTTYIAKLQKRIDKDTKKLSKVLHATDFKKLEHKIINHLPHGIKEKDLHLWQQNQYDSIDKLKVDIANDETIHDIRKRVKDIMFTTSFIKNTETKKKTTELTTLAKALGDQHDLSVQISLLEAHIKYAPPKEHTMLLKIAKKWATKKMRLKKKIAQKLQ